ncbi:MAG: hypothetical protein EAX91_16740 [Candidatus Lokiarchaeota archaeon]|nr:hypothetical protein [Candidatus Lokiarchaeota archaeon]
MFCRKKSFSITIILLTLIFIQFQDYAVINTTANPAPVRIIGGFLPMQNVSLSLTTADVLLEIDATDFPKNLKWNFEGNYTIYNPNNLTEIPIAFPFFSPYFANLSLEVDGNPINPGYIEFFESNSDMWTEYLDTLSDDYPRSIIVCNIPFPPNDSLNVELNFNTLTYGIYSDIGYSNYDIIYDVGTSRVWNGNISESVEFKVHGRQPDHFFAANQSISSEFEDGKSYAWMWDNEIININLVGISYLGVPSGAPDPLIFITFIRIIGIGVIIGAVALCFKKIKR